MVRSNDDQPDPPINLSIVITIVGSPDLLENCLTNLCQQVEGKAIEILVPHDDTCKGIVNIRDQFAQVEFLDMGAIKTRARPTTYSAKHELYDRRRSYGLTLAKGEIVALLDDACIPNPDWVEQILLSHKLPYAVIGGAVENASNSPLNWAIYFQDFGRYQNPLKEGAVDQLTDINVSYKRFSLELIRDCWTDRYNEIIVHRTFLQRGEVLWQNPRIVVCMNRGRLKFFDLLKERLAWGRLFGSVRAKSSPRDKRLLLIASSPGILLLLLGRMAKKVILSRRNRLHFLVSFPLILPLTSSWCLGELMGSVTLSE
jgi:hypothetical protein